MGEMPKRLMMLLLAMLLAAAAPPLPPQLNDPTTTEGYIWQRVRVGEVERLRRLRINGRTGLARGFAHLPDPHQGLAAFPLRTNGERVGAWMASVRR
jgi:hypothetical protein